MLDFDSIDDLKNTDKILVAVSGGCDSLALVFITKEWTDRNKKEIFTITIDHKMRPTSTDEAKCVHDLLEKNNIKHVIKTCTSTINSELEAREIRYNLIFKYMLDENIKVVFMAHHLQDQAENFLIRLFRGSGIKGLSSMSKVTKMQDFTIVRPVLNITKEYLQQYLVKKNINWYEDETNKDEKYLRNKIRNFLNSFENKNDIIRRINKEITFFQNAENIISNNLNSYIKKQETKKVSIIDLDEFNLLNDELKYRYIINIIKDITDFVYSPRFEKLKRLVENINTFKKCELANCVFEKKDNFILVYKEKKVKVIGITGSIASGKSTMVNYLKEMGYKVFESDNEVRLLYNDNIFLEKVNELLGTTDKNKISKTIFYDKEKKQQLENLIHPIIEKKCDDFINKNNNERYIFIDVPLLYEVGWDKKCNKVILIVVAEHIQRDRFIKRGGGGVEIFERIIENQFPIEIKKQKHPIIIENNGTLEDFYKKIQSIKFIKQENI